MGQRLQTVLEQQWTDAADDKAADDLGTDNDGPRTLGLLGLRYHVKTESGVAALFHAWT